MKKVNLALYYFGIVLLGVVTFYVLRWTVISYEPVYTERVKQKLLSPEEVEARGLTFEVENKYFQVEKEKTYISAGKFPTIHTKSYLQKELKIKNDQDESTQ